MEPTLKVLSDAKAFADALNELVSRQIAAETELLSHHRALLGAATTFAASVAANGDLVHPDALSLVAFTQSELQDALKGHPAKLLDRANALQVALDALSAPVEA